MRIKVTSVYVDDQDEALRFYTDVLGFVKKADVTQGPFRWLTVASPEEPDGAELQLAPNDDPAAQAHQRALFAQGRPAAVFYVDDAQRAHDRLRPLGAAFTTPPTKVAGATSAVVDDTCGNLVQLAALDRRG
jgi:catechol 2,3-dioxygenase-like lactoylglutathione lyase family enzyme